MSAATPGRVCPHCGAQIKLTDEVCPKCLATVVQLSPTTTLRKSPRTAAVVSVVWPGLGQLYIGQTMRGAVLVIFAVLFAAPVLAETRLLNELGLIAFLSIWIYGIYDAFNRAKAIGEGAI